MHIINQRFTAARKALQNKSETAFIMQIHVTTLPAISRLMRSRFEWNIQSAFQIGFASGDDELVVVSTLMGLKLIVSH